MFYASKDLIGAKSHALKSFISRGGDFRLYLADPKNFLWRRTAPTTVVESEAAQIYDTARAFAQLFDVLGSGRLQIHAVEDGVTSMIARIQASGETIFLISPFRMHRDAHGKPVVVLMQRRSPKDEIDKYFDAEIAHLEKSPPFPLYERKRLLAWASDRSNRVFVSASLQCQGKCDYCYIDSLVNNFSPVVIKPHLMIDEIARSRHFIEGRHGTRIMMGGFSDPLSPLNKELTVHLIEELGPLGNLIHIATKWPVQFDIAQRISDATRGNVAINFSCSSIRRGLERSTPAPKERMASGKLLTDLGILTALYVRPVIFGVTVQDIEEIGALAIENNITTATVGGIYVDERIRSNLSHHNVTLPSAVLENRQFVLDNERHLKKLEDQDVHVVQSKLRHMGFDVFSSSQGLMDSMQ
jgi:DNA repair photolyase